ncbi:hypothetical protein BC567DRAFT_222599 [Phyllosticta citribraziliensis]
MIRLDSAYPVGFLSRLCRMAVAVVFAYVCLYSLPWFARSAGRQPAMVCLRST